MTTTTRRTAKMTTKPYTPTALFRVFDKKTGACLGYLAPSRDGKEHYQVTCDHAGRWHCTCKATVEQCCHVKAAQELCKLRVEAGKPGCFQGKATAGVEVATKTAPRVIEDWGDMETPAQIAASKMTTEAAPGTLHSAAKGSFLDALFGNSKDMAAFRSAYVAARQ